MKADPLSESDRRRVATYIEQTAGIQMPASKKSLIETRLRKRQRALQFTTLHGYIDFVFTDSTGEAELIHLVDALTTNKTDFYREPQHFTFLRNYLSQGYDSAGQPLRFWSAGCSTGEEPFTLAIEMLEFQRQFSNFKFSITATDISRNCLQKAQHAIYPHDKIEPMDMVLRRRYLLRARNKEDERIQIAPEVKKMIEFQFFNLINGNWSQFSQKFDVIFCRNVMIYFNNEDRAMLTNRFSESLKPGGLLMIGHSETLIDNAPAFSRLQPTIYRREAHSR